MRSPSSKTQNLSYNKSWVLSPIDTFRSVHVVYRIHLSFLHRMDNRSSCTIIQSDDMTECFIFVVDQTSDWMKARTKSVKPRHGIFSKDFFLASKGYLHSFFLFFSNTSLSVLTLRPSAPRPQIPSTSRYMMLEASWIRPLESM